MKLSIVIPVYNKCNFTESCLKDLIELPSHEHEIIVVDNASADATARVVDTYATHLPHIQYVRNDRNLGFAKACNVGFSCSTGDAVMFLNNDVRVERELSTWTQPIRIAVAAEPNVLVGPTVGHLNSNLDFVREDSRLCDEYDYMSGWNLTASRSTWEQLILPHEIGPFTSEFGLAYFEDTDLSYRAKQKGFKFRVVSVPVIHFGRVTSSSIGLSSLYKPAQTLFKKKWASNG